jgi:hypothetical protein
MTKADATTPLGQPPKLDPCPFCGHHLQVTWRRANPKAKCATVDCWGGKSPVVMLDIPEQVAAWNQRALGPNVRANLDPTA